MLNGRATPASYPPFGWEVPITGLSSLLGQDTAFVPICRGYFREISVSSHFYFLIHFPNLWLQISLFQGKGDLILLTVFSCSIYPLLLSLLLYPLPLFHQPPKTATLPRTHQSRFTYCHDSKSSSCKKCFFSWDFFNQINVFFLASTDMICYSTYRSSD